MLRFSVPSTGGPRRVTPGETVIFDVIASETLEYHPSVRFGVRYARLTETIGPRAWRYAYSVSAADTGTALVTSGGTLAIIPNIFVVGYEPPKFGQGAFGLESFGSSTQTSGVYDYEADPFRFRVELAFEGPQVILTWSEDAGSVKIVRKEWLPPAAHDDGDEVYSGDAAVFADRTAVAGTCYYYAIYKLTETGYALAGSAHITPVDNRPVIGTSHVKPLSLYEYLPSYDRAAANSSSLRKLSETELATGEVVNLGMEDVSLNIWERLTRVFSLPLGLIRRQIELLPAAINHRLADPETLSALERLLGMPLATPLSLAQRRSLIADLRTLYSRMGSSAALSHAVQSWLGAHTVRIVEPSQRIARLASTALATADEDVLSAESESGILLSQEVGGVGSPRNIDIVVSSPLWTSLRTSLGQVTGVQAAPPVSPVNGTLYAITAGATGAWEGRDGLLATRRDGQWQFRQPALGDYVTSSGVPYALCRTATSPWLTYQRVLTQQEADAFSWWVSTFVLPQNVSARLREDTVLNALTVVSGVTTLYDNFEGWA